MTMLPLIDAAGQKHAPVDAKARIVSLVPSLTELLFELGLGAQVVGRTRYCVHPAEQVRHVPVVGGTKSIRIDDVRRLEPSHLVVNVDETPRAAADAAAALEIDVVVTHPIQVNDNAHMYRFFGDLFDRQGNAAALLQRFHAARVRIDAAVRQWPHRNVLYLIWSQPWMTVASNTYISQMLRLARLHTVVMNDASGARYPTIDLDDALLDRVELVLFASEPFPFRLRHVAAFCRAFPRHREKAQLINGKMLSWYGARAIEGIDYLAGFAKRFSARLAG